MKPGDALTTERAYRLPAGSVVRDMVGCEWVAQAPLYRGARRYWWPRNGHAVGGWSTRGLVRHRGPITLVSRPVPAAAVASSEPPGDGG